MSYLLSLLVFIAVLSGFLLLVAKFSKKKDRKLLIDAANHEEQLNQNVVPNEIAKIGLAVEPLTLPLIKKTVSKERISSKKKVVPEIIVADKKPRKKKVIPEIIDIPVVAVPKKPRKKKVI